MNTPEAGLRPLSLAQARQQRHDHTFITSWIQRVIRRFPAHGTERQELTAAGMLGAEEAIHAWEQLPEQERTEQTRRKLIATGIRRAIRASWNATNGRGRSKRAAALQAATWAGAEEFEGISLSQRFVEMRSALNHEAYAGLLHGSLGMESPENAYLDREQQQLDRDRIQFAIARLERPDDRIVAHKLLVEGASLVDACAAVGIHEKSKRSRTRKRIFDELKQHAAAFTSTLGPRRKPSPPPDDNPDT